MNVALSKALLTLGAVTFLGPGTGLAQQTQLFAVGRATGNSPTPTTFTIDRSTGFDAPVGPLGDAATLPFGLAVSEGRLLTFDGNTDQIREIDPATGAFTGTPVSVGVGNLTGEGDIAFGLNGIGYLTTATTPGGALNEAPALYTFNLSTGTSTLVGTTSDAEGPLTVDGLAFNPANSLLYAITQQDDRLYTLNPSSGFLTPVGSLGVAPNSGFGALTFDGPTLYGIINDTLYTIDASTGTATAVGAGFGTDFASVSGLAAVVPEPSTVALLGLAAAGLCSRRRRR
jgi:hypothetical protein